MRPFYQAGYIRQHEALLFVNSNNPQIRRQGCEGIVGDLWLGGGNSGKKGRFPGVWVSHKSHVGDKPQFQFQRLFFAWLTLFRHPGDLVLTALEPRVTPATQSTSGDDKSLPGGCEIDQKLI